MTAPAADLAGRTCVLTQKASGLWVRFQCYADPADAQRIADRLRSFGAKVDLQPEQQQEVVR